MKRRRFLALASSVFVLIPKYYGAFAENGTDPSQIVARIENYINNIKTLSAGFVQVDPDGNVAKGRIYLQRPGRLRFEYDEPSPLLIVADGVWLILYDKQLGQVSRYPLYETPLGLLVDTPANLQKKVEVVNIERGPGLLRIKVVNRFNSDDGWIRFTFSEPPLMLRHWKVKDVRGGTTALALNNIRMNQNLNPNLFFFEDPTSITE